MTHIRQDRILDLEKDDYSNFPSLSYARGFLLIYARLLGVDVSEAAVRLENSNPVDIEEYEYLSGKPAPLTRSLGVGRRIAGVLGIIFCIFLMLALVVRHFINYANRLDDPRARRKRRADPEASPQATPPAPATPRSRHRAPRLLQWQCPWHQRFPWRQRSRGRITKWCCAP